ncbi:MAG: hypothetical protein LBE75_05705 [Burkholderiales bacterium]|jgi:hypothetical protein|nr:hypothetical protein [Burkholderiales bacterium]
MRIKHLPPIVYVLVLIIWQWWAYSEEFPGEWYRSLATGLFVILFCFLPFVVSIVCALSLEHMSSRVSRFAMKILELNFAAFSIFYLYKGMGGDRVRLPNESLESLFLALTIIGYFLTREAFCRMLRKPLLGGLNGVSVLDEVKLFKDGKFQEVRACVAMALFLLFLYAVHFSQAGWVLFHYKQT